MRPLNRIGICQEWMDNKYCLAWQLITEWFDVSATAEGQLISACICFKRIMCGLRRVVFDTGFNKVNAAGQVMENPLAMRTDILRTDNFPKGAHPKYPIRGMAKLMDNIIRFLWMVAGQGKVVKAIDTPNIKGIRRADDDIARGRRGIKPKKFSVKLMRPHFKSGHILFGQSLNQPAAGR